jgi:F-type H+-transporting ATPase subunit a
MNELPIIFPMNKIIAMGVPPYVAFSLLATLLIVIFALTVNKSLKLVPTGAQNFIEVIAEFLLDLVDTSIGHMGRYFFPLVATLFIYILVCNTLGIKIHKSGYIKHFVGPIRSVAALPLMILMLFIELVGHLARPLTLSVRLFGNMMAKHMLIMILATMAPWIVPIPILTLGVLVSVVQALVFTLLTALYLAGSVEEAH